MFERSTGPVNSHSVSQSASLNTQEVNGSQNIQTAEDVGKRVYATRQERGTGY